MLILTIRFAIGRDVFRCELPVRNQFEHRRMNGKLIKSGPFAGRILQTIHEQEVCNSVRGEWFCETDSRFKIRNTATLRKWLRNRYSRSRFKMNEAA